MQKIVNGNHRFPISNGIKKFLVILLLFLSLYSTGRVVLAFEIPPRPTTYVNDYAGILTDGEEQSLEQKLEDFEYTSTNEIAVVIISSLDGDSVENVAQEIFTAWGIGKKDKNNGALFLISMEEHRTRIHTGYGLEPTLTDIGTSYIQREVVTPAFREEKYYEGINQALDRMIELTKGEFVVPENSSQNNDSGLPWHFIIIVFVVILQWLAAIFARSKSWWLGGVVGGGIGLINLGLNLFGFGLIGNILTLVALTSFGTLLDYFVSKKYQNVVKSGGNLPW